jgi:hypothetical protein
MRTCPGRDAIKQALPPINCNWKLYTNEMTHNSPGKVLLDSISTCLLYIAAELQHHSTSLLVNCYTRHRTYLAIRANKLCVQDWSSRGPMITNHTRGFSTCHFLRVCMYICLYVSMRARTHTHLHTRNVIHQITHADFQRATSCRSCMYICTYLYVWIVCIHYIHT